MDANSGIELKDTGADDEDIKKMLDDVVNTQQTQTVDSNTAEDPEEPPNPLVNEAFEHLKEIFARNFHNAMVEAGNYIILHFYGGDYIAALAKNKTKDQPPNLKALINKIRQAPKANENGVPSIGWFYNAVNLSAHEHISAQEGLQTFGILGHSHKLQLLHTPKVKAIQADEFEDAIKSAFQEKERLAKHAYENELSVRDFKKYITEQHPSNGIDLTALPPKSELRKIESKELVKLWNKSNKKVEDVQRQTDEYKIALQSLEIVLAEIGSRPIEGKGRFQDWTKPKNNVNICTGCKNDCLYCYMKKINVGNPKLKQPVDWHNWELRQKDVDANRGLKDGLVGFPSSHDIFPEILDPYLFVLGKLLRAGNEVLIVSKPNFECIQAICAASQFFRDKIIFRFTIGAMDDSILQIFESNAPSYEERKACLRYAFEQGYRTSVSMEPMLDTPHVDQLIEDLRPFVNWELWLGTMNHLKTIKKLAYETLVTEVAKIGARQSPEIQAAMTEIAKMEAGQSPEILAAMTEVAKIGTGQVLEILASMTEVAKIEVGQSPEMLTDIFNTYKDDELIKWKTDALKIIQTAQHQVEKSQIQS